jgi:hypothetical protein
VQADQSPPVDPERYCQASKRIARCLQMLETFVADADGGGGSDAARKAAMAARAAAVAALAKGGGDNNDSKDGTRGDQWLQPEQPGEFHVDVFVVGERIMPEMHTQDVYSRSSGRAGRHLRLARPPSVSYRKCASAGWPHVEVCQCRLKLLAALLSCSFAACSSLAALLPCFASLHCFALVSSSLSMLPWLFLFASFFSLPASSRCQLILVASFFSLPASSR